jgi:phosphatidate cytidylyltransferase
MQNKPAGAFSDPNLIKRVVSALVLAPLVVYIAYLGGFPFMILCLLAACIMVYEWYNMAKGAAFTLPKALLYAFGFAFATILIRISPQYGLAALAWLTLIVWGTDVGAYFAGRSIGGPKLSPKFSPNKTWSGAIGGMVIGTFAACYAMTWFGIVVSPMLVVVSLVVSAFSQVGDIFESSLKRKYGVKDASNLIPGHGGVMDRLDGFVFAAILAFLIGFFHNKANIAQGLLFW